jgi:transcriptional regulator with XRE-family HTH domain
MMQGSLAHRLRVLRAERGLTLREAAAKSGVAKETISDIERGLRHPHDPTLAKIAKGYGVPVEELLEEPALAAGKGEAPRRTGWTEKGEWLEEPYVEVWARYLEGQCDLLNAMLDTEDISDDSIRWIAAQTINLAAIYAHDRVEECPEAKLGGKAAEDLDRAAGEFKKLCSRAIRVAPPQWKVRRKLFRASAREGFSLGRHAELDDTARAIFGRETR